MRLGSMLMQIVGSAIALGSLTVAFLEYRKNPAEYPRPLKDLIEQMSLAFVRQLQDKQAPAAIPTPTQTETSAPGNISDPITTENSTVPIADPDIPPTPLLPLATLIDARSLGKKLFEIEKIAGQAIRFSEGWRVYNVEQCEISFWFDPERGVVTRMSTSLSGSCGLYWQKIIPALENIKPPESLTFGQVIDVAPEQAIAQVGGCLSDCAQAQTASVALYRVGGKTEDYTETVYETGFERDTELPARQTLEHKIVPQFGRRVSKNLWMICDRRVIGFVKAAMGLLTVKRIEIAAPGTFIKAGTCDLTTRASRSG